MSATKTTYTDVAGAVRVVGSMTERKHFADGMVAVVQMGDGAAHVIINPQSFELGGPAWHLTWGNVEGVRYTAASLLDSYDYLLSGAISMSEATRRLRLLRAARKELASTPYRHVSTPYRLPDGTLCDYRTWLLAQPYIVSDGPLICDDMEALHA